MIFNHSLLHEDHLGLNWKKAWVFTGQSTVGLGKLIGSTSG
jgi:hypothetical protein